MVLFFHSSSSSSLAACSKHFLGDGGTNDGIDRGDNLSTEADLRDLHGAGYFSALEAGVQTVMASFSSWGYRSKWFLPGKKSWSCLHVAA